VILSATAQHALRAVLSLASGAVEPPVRASELAIPSEKLSLLEVAHQVVDFFSSTTIADVLE